MEIKLRSFESKILYFNGMYKLPVAPYPCFYKEAENIRSMFKMPDLTEPEAMWNRLVKFKEIILKEVSEVEDILAKLGTAEEIDILTDLADWLGDMIVYCASEMARTGIPIDKTLSIIMDSNFSKLDVNGNPIYDPQTGKVEKGPFYWKPEPKIKKMLLETIKENGNATKQSL